MTGTGLKALIRNQMLEEPKTLYSIPDLLDIFKNHEQLKSKDGIQKAKAIENMLRNLRVDKEIFRHVDRDENDDLQYAVSIPDAKIEHWVLSTTMGQGNPTKNGGVPKKRKGQLLSSKEIRSMFAAHYNNMAKLEDSCMAIIERSEMTEKEMAKIRSFLKG